MQNVRVLQKIWVAKSIFDDKFATRSRIKLNVINNIVHLEIGLIQHSANRLYDSAF